MNRISEYDLALVEDLQSLKLDGQQGVIIENAIARISQPNASNGVSEGWNEAIEAAAVEAASAFAGHGKQFGTMRSNNFEIAGKRIAERIRALAKPLTDQKS